MNDPLNKSNGWQDDHDRLTMVDQEAGRLWLAAMQIVDDMENWRKPLTSYNLAELRECLDGLNELINEYVWSMAEAETE